MSNIERLKQVMAALRDERSGCPWDLAQSFYSLVPHTLEEAYEVAEAIERGDLGELRDELGDLLFQIIFYARLAEEQQLFDFEAVVRGIIDKLERRHPHVFGDSEIVDATAQSRAWEEHKAKERAHKAGHSGALAGVATALPALTRAAKLQRRAARMGFDWQTIAPIFDKVREELDEVAEELREECGQARVEEEIGDLLFACVNLARHAHIDPESALRKANRKFTQRFEYMESQLQAKAQSLEALSAEAWEHLWEQAKTHQPADDTLD